MSIVQRHSINIAGKGAKTILAVHYRSDDPPVIHISAEARDHQWLFSCEDNGVGIAPNYQARIFEAFKRLHGSEKPGSGIGLTVCKKSSSTTKAASGLNRLEIRVRRSSLRSQDVERILLTGDAR